MKSASTRWSILRLIPLVGFWVCLDPFPQSPFQIRLRSDQFSTFTHSVSAQPAPQSIVPEPNSTNTTVNQTGNQIDINGGQLSGDGGNLFHSFTRFNVETGQVANFLANDSIQNILSRVVGGEASQINGLIQVTGSNANLFLVNPAGIVFGAAAQLNVPAAFTATTATGIGFESGWFNVLESNDYSSLVGTPTSFAFATAAPGSIVNSGQLEVKPGQPLTLIGGTVVNTGELIAPGGSVTVAAVPGESVVRISHLGHLLNLEIVQTDFPGAEGFAPLSLPELLTGESGASATGVEVLSDGTLKLTNTESSSEVPLPPESGTAILAGKISTAETDTESTQLPQINLLGDRIGLFSAEIDASGFDQGGTVRIGGDQRGADTLPTATRTLVDPDTTISANGLGQGSGGNIILWSDEVTHFSGSIQATGTQGGFAEISSWGSLAIEGTVDLTGADGSVGTLLLDPENITIVDVGDGSLGQETAFDPELLADAEPEEVTLSESTLENVAATADIILEARNNNQINDLTADQLNLQATTGTVTFRADADGDGRGRFSMNPEDQLQTAGGTLNITAAEIEVGHIFTDGGNINLIATQGDLTTGSLATNGTQQSGNIMLVSNGELETASLSTQAQDPTTGRGGDLDIVATDNLTIDFINASGADQGGNVILESLTGDITLLSEDYSIDTTSANGIGGDITVTTPQTLRLDVLNARGGIAGGNLELSATQEMTLSAINTGRLPGRSAEADSQFSDPGGKITLTSDEINLIGQVRSDGVIELQPATPTLEILVGSSSNSGPFLDLTDTELAQLQDGFSQIIVGREDVSGNVLLSGDLTFQDPTVIRASGGQIVHGGEFPEQVPTLAGVDNASLTLVGDRGINLGQVTTEAQDISLESPSGQVTVTGIQILDPFATADTTTSPISNGTELRITANEIDFAGGANSIQSSGAITLQPANPDQPINLGTAADTEGLDITPANWAALANGFEQITIGQADGSAVITLDENFTFRDPLVLQAGNDGSVVANGDLVGVDDATLRVETGGNILLGNLTIPGSEIQLQSTQGEIVTGNLQLTPGTTVNSEVTLQAGQSIATGDITTSGNSQGGDILLDAGGGITTGRLSTRSPSGNAGNVQLSAANDIEVVTINTQGVRSGGDIQVQTDRFFRATGRFALNNVQDASLSSLGAEQSGAVDLQRGGDVETPFEIGNPTVNGTAAIIFDGQVTTQPPPANPDTPGSNPSSPVTDPTVEATQPPTANPGNTPIPPDSVESEDSSSVIQATEENNSAAATLTDPIQIDEPSAGLDESTEGSQSLPEAVINIEPTTIATDQIAKSSVNQSILQIDQLRDQQFTDYLGKDSIRRLNRSQDIRQILGEVSQVTGYKPAVLYVSVERKQLELRLLLPNGQSVFKRVPVKREQLLEVARDFTNQVRSPKDFQDTGYKDQGQKLYEWLIQPLETELDGEAIDTLIFSMDSGLRTLPIAALFDGQQFLLERYSLGLIPSLSLTDMSYVNLKNSKVLAMGASQFLDSEQRPLPAVPLELNLILGEGGWTGAAFLNEAFTVDNLTTQRSQTQFDIIHLATHGEFLAGGADQSYIQFWDRKLRLDEIEELKLDSPPVELLVLSACTTAVGDEEAELGFAGLAVKTGVKSALASLWYVSDAGTLGLMSQFYESLQTSSIKAEALRQAQLAMLQGKIKVHQGKLINGEQVISFDETSDTRSHEAIPGQLPIDGMGNYGTADLSHPFYWAGFTLIGSPW
ncbi:MAG: CHAT domain-containing protein [Microcoleaceae cyanobacterium]